MQPVVDWSLPAEGWSYYSITKHSAAILLPYAYILCARADTEDTLEA